MINTEECDFCRNKYIHNFEACAFIFPRRIWPTKPTPYCFECIDNNVKMSEPDAALCKHIMPFPANTNETHSLMLELVKRFKTHHATSRIFKEDCPSLYRRIPKHYWVGFAKSIILLDNLLSNKEGSPIITNLNKLSRILHISHSTISRYIIKYPESKFAKILKDTKIKTPTGQTNTD